jgi:hypothetical protein
LAVAKSRILLFWSLLFLQFAINQDEQSYKRHQRISQQNFHPSLPSFSSISTMQLLNHLLQNENHGNTVSLSLVVVATPAALLLLLLVSVVAVAAKAVAVSSVGVVSVTLVTTAAHAVAAGTALGTVQPLSVLARVAAVARGSTESALLTRLRGRETRGRVVGRRAGTRGETH